MHLFEHLSVACTVDAESPNFGLLHHKYINVLAADYDDDKAVDDWNSMVTIAMWSGVVPVGLLGHALSYIKYGLTL